MTQPPVLVTPNSWLSWATVHTGLVCTLFQNECCIHTQEALLGCQTISAGVRSPVALHFTFRWQTCRCERSKTWAMSGLEKLGPNSLPIAALSKALKSVLGIELNFFCVLMFIASYWTYKCNEISLPHFTTFSSSKRRQSRSLQFSSSSAVAREGSPDLGHSNRRQQ